MLCQDAISARAELKCTDRFHLPSSRPSQSAILSLRSAPRHTFEFRGGGGCARRIFRAAAKFTTKFTNASYSAVGMANAAAACFSMGNKQRQGDEPKME